MADPKLELIRKLLREEADKKNGVKQASGDNASYAFWDIPENSTATIRFLPDKDDSNPWFWSERQVIKLPFAGTINGDFDGDKEVYVTVPCVDMFGDTCPIIAETRPWWKDESKKDIARRYYKRRSFITQGFVVSSPSEEKNVPENPIRRFMIGNELIEKLKAGMADPEMENLPTDYVNGTDFRIRKTKKGDYNNYGTSEWSRRSRPLTELEVTAIDQFGLFNLADFRGSRPDADGIAAIKAMFHASLNGDPYDFSEFGKYFRPYGGNDNDDDAAVSKPAVKASTETLKPTTKASASSGPSPQAPDLLNKLRERVAASNTK